MRNKVYFSNGIQKIDNYAFNYCEKISNVYYAGTADDWSYVTIGSKGNDAILNAVIHYNSTIPTPTVMPTVTPTAIPTVNPTTTPTPTASVPTLTPKPESGYSIENGTLSGVDEKTSLETLAKNLENGESIVVAKANGETVTDNSALIGTGYTVSILDEKGNVVESAVVAVVGDINGDGSINSRDIAALQKHVTGMQLLADAFLLAADYNGVDKVNSRDIAALQKKIIG